MASLALTSADRDWLTALRTFCTISNELNGNLEQVLEASGNLIISMFDNENDELLKIDHEGGTNAELMSIWFEEKICSLAELALIIDGTHEFYSMESDSSQRLGQFFFEVRDGVVGTGPMCTRWEKARAASPSDEAALIELWAQELS